MPDSANHERYAALDLGSNSFHLLLAEFRDQRMVRLHTDRAMVRLAEGLDAERNLDPRVAERALAALRRFQPVLEKLPVDHIRVVGTNTLRAANNADDFLEAAEQLLGAPIEIISGIEEARLIYSGVMAAASAPPRQYCVIDIGGGSTELVRGRESPEQLQSLFMGCVSYSRRFFPGGEIASAQTNHFDRARRAARAELQELHHLASDAMVVGASGTVKAVARVLNGGELGDIERNALDRLAAQVEGCAKISDLKIPHLEPDRRPVFAAGLAILHGIFCELNIKRMQISPYAIREGIVHDLAGRLHGGDRRADTVAALMSRWHIDRAQANRVGNTALALLQQVWPESGVADQKLLRWACDLHEIGLALSHSSYRKLGAYMIAHADLAGFSNSVQENLAHLVRNQRGTIKPPREHYGFHPRAERLLCLRIACIVHRDHTDRELDGMQLHAHNPSHDGTSQQFTLQISRAWLHNHPAIEDLLLQEVEYWQSQPSSLQLSAL